MLHILSFFSSKCRLFHNATVFGSCVIRILRTGCVKIYMKNSGAKRLMVKRLIQFVLWTVISNVTDMNFILLCTDLSLTLQRFQ
jgi:hypothetical protein